MLKDLKLRIKDWLAGEEKDIQSFTTPPPTPQPVQYTEPSFRSPILNTIVPSGLYPNFAGTISFSPYSEYYPDNFYIPFKTPISCWYCGAKTKEGDRKCPYCGRLYQEEERKDRWKRSSYQRY